MRIVVGEGSCGLAAGAGKVHEALAKLGADVGITGCIGMCFLEPVVDLYDGNALAARLVRVKEGDAERIFKAVGSGDLSGVEDLKIAAEDAEFLAKQTRIALRHCGIIDPESLDDYRAADGYKAIAKILGVGGAAGRASRRGSSGTPRATRRATRSTSSATPTKATPARSWTAPSSRATRTRSSRAC